MVFLHQNFISFRAMVENWIHLEDTRAFSSFFVCVRIEIQFCLLVISCQKNHCKQESIFQIISSPTGIELL